MAEKKRGLPADFSLNVPKEVVNDDKRPAQLGDYLDEMETTPKVVEFPQRQAARPASLEPDEALSDRQKPSSRRRRKKVKTPPRKQVNMTPETLQMVDDLLAHIREYSDQKDPKASELFEAIVGAAHEAQNFIDLSDVPPRGRWGTPMATAFRVNLKNAVRRAVYQFHLSQTQR